MLNAIAYIIATGFLVRASGWGNEGRWKRIAEFFSDYTCAIIFGMLSAIFFEWQTGLACGAAFLLYRVPAFHGWQNWGEMFIRGFWPTAVGFGLIGFAAGTTPLVILLSVPFAALYMLAYSGGYKWLPEIILGFPKHTLIEQASGWLLGAFIVYLLQLGGASAPLLSPSLA